MAPLADGVEIRPQRATVAFLLIHGFCAAPDELRTLSHYLEDLSIASFAVRLAGHGTTPEDLMKTRWSDWYNSVQGGIEHVRSWNPEYLFIAGFSMGGALSILLASEETNVDGLVLLAPALRIDGLLPKFAPILKHFIKDRKIDVTKAQEPYEIKRTKYSREPISAYHELFKLQKNARKKMRLVNIPTIIIQGTNDRTINPQNAIIVYDKIESKEKELHFIEGGEHVIPCHWSRTKVNPLIQKFVERVIRNS